MMKGMDLQVMTHRPVNYTPLAAEQLAKSEHAEEYAARMTRQSVQRQAEGVTGAEHAEGKQVTQKRQREQEPRERGKKREKEAQEEARRAREEEAQEEARRAREKEARLPSVGYAEGKLLDIEI